MSAIDVNRFSAAVKTKRGGRGLREVAQEIRDVSASTLSRIEQGSIPDLETYFRICSWLGVSPESFSQAQVPADSPTANLADTIEQQLRAEKKLPDEAINTIAQVVRFAYQAADAKKLLR
jgi:transcriptional regulator with XRE-family HTH domain